MKLNKLKQLIQQYDQEKAWYRSIKDLDQIILLKEFIEAKENDRDFSLTGQNISYFEFLEFAQQRNVVLSEAYLNSGSKSAHLFKTWEMNSKIEPLAQAVLNESSALQTYAVPVISNSLSFFKMPILQNLPFSFWGAKNLFNQFAKDLSETDKDMLFESFWKKPDSLQDQCLNTIAKQAIKDRDSSDLINQYEKLPEELKIRLEGKFMQAEKRLNLMAINGLLHRSNALSC